MLRGLLAKLSAKPTFVKLTYVKFSELFQVGSHGCFGRGIGAGKIAPFNVLRFHLFDVGERIKNVQAVSQQLAKDAEFDAAASIPTPSFDKYFGRARLPISNRPENMGQFNRPMPVQHLPVYFETADEQVQALGQA